MKAVEDRKRGQRELGCRGRVKDNRKRQTEEL